MKLFDVKRSQAEPKVLTAPQIDHYLSSQGDPMVGDHTGRWRFVESSGGWDLNSSLPLAMHFRLGSEIDWDSLGDTEPQSEALWKYSAGYLPSLLIASNDEALVNEVLSGLAAYTRSNAWSERAGWMTSVDHSYATRIRTMCTLAVLYQSRGSRLPQAAKALVAHDVMTLANGSEEFFPTNNHGAMTAISLMHAGRVFDPYEAVLPIAWVHLKRILNELFDEHGLAGENSPEYQQFWIKFLKPLDELLIAWPAPHDDTAMLQGIVDRARLALSHFTDHNGLLLPIGDSHPYRSLVSPAQNTTMLFERHGFLTYSHENTHFTLNCGHSNYAHKHCDDTAVTLSHLGVPLLLDSGYFGHDWRDSKVIYTKSQSAHSGVFLTEFDDLHPGRLYSPDKEVLKGAISELPGDEGWEGIVRVQDGRQISRRVKIRDPQTIRITDRVISLGIPSPAVQRLMVPYGADMTIGVDRFVISFRGAQMELTFEGDRTPGEFRINSGIETPTVRGWSSPQRDQLVPGMCIERDISADTDCTIEIVLGKAA